MPSKFFIGDAAQYTRLFMDERGALASPILLRAGKGSTTVVGRLVEQLEKGDGEGGGAEAVGDEDAAEVFVKPKLEVLQVGLVREGRDVELFERFGDAFGLRA